MRDDDPIPRGPERGRGLGVAVDVVGPTVEEHHGLTVGRPDLHVSDVERTGVALLHRPDRRRSVAPARTTPAPWQPTFAIADSITSTTACGCEIMIRCEPATSVMSAP